MLGTRPDPSPANKLGLEIRLAQSEKFATSATLV